MSRNVLTIATGKGLYIKLAVNLYHSFIYWNESNDIQFFLVTDRPDLINASSSKKLNIVTIEPNQFGEGFSTKLWLDELAPPGQTLFIDSDCLIFGRIDALFDRFKGNPVTVVGTYCQEGEWFGNIEAICKRFNVSQIPKFNGGIYYIEKGPIATDVYIKARELEREYDEIGFIRLRNRPNDEVIMALSMQLKKMIPVKDDGTIMSDPQSCPGGYDIDVITGNRWLVNPPPPHPLHQQWYPFIKVSPVIVHFLGYYTQHYPYKREVYRLKLKLTGRLNPLSDFICKLKLEYPERFKLLSKKTFRSSYHRIFGVRKVKPSERI
ncbi:hypothetical protein ACFSJU_01390 [Paradesertivirga mongoliensis]|uniref:Glycosyl transferase family 8 n=1 Tax=Paradesertivirga mongoliensis TaxID=2100740 RepID=A0ABW4ZG57_9SPHI|nr:hypothetical protein [Pedobacter mongoliensis]